MKTIRFKSTPDNFRKEYLGLKCNTIRKWDRESDVRFDILDDFIKEKFVMIEIEIVNKETMESFTRKITDVAKFDDYYIISWKE